MGKFWPGDQLVTASGPSRGSNSESSEDDSSPQSRWCLTKSDNRDCPSTEHETFGHRKQHSAKEVKTLRIHALSDTRKSARLTKTFHEYPERLQSYLTRAEAAFVDATLGQLWEEVVPLCAYL